MTDGTPDLAAVATGTRAVFRLGGAVARAGAVTVDELRAFPAHTLRAEFDCSCGDLRQHVFSGPRLYDVIMAAGAEDGTPDPYVVSVTGADGYQTTVSWDEIAPPEGGAGVLLAIAVDGHGVDDAGPRLAVPHDQGGGRCVTGVTEVWIGAPGQNA